MFSPRVVHEIKGAARTYFLAAICHSGWKPVRHRSVRSNVCGVCQLRSSTFNEVDGLAKSKLISRELRGYPRILRSRGFRDGEATSSRVRDAKSPDSPGISRQNRLMLIVNPSRSIDYRQVRKVSPLMYENAPECACSRRRKISRKRRSSGCTKRVGRVAAVRGESLKSYRVFFFPPTYLEIFPQPDFPRKRSRHRSTPRPVVRFAFDGIARMRIRIYCYFSTKFQYTRRVTFDIRVRNDNIISAHCTDFLDPGRSFAADDRISRP